MDDYMEQRQEKSSSGNVSKDSAVANFTEWCGMKLSFHTGYIIIFLKCS